LELNLIMRTLTKMGFFSLIPRPPVSTWDTHQNLNGCLSLRVTSQLIATIGYEEQDFEGALLWFTPTGVFGTQGRKVSDIASSNG